MPPSAPAAFYEQARQDAARAALLAWQAIEHFYEGQYHITEKDEGPCTEADRMADRLIVEQLARDYPEPEYAYLTEESEAQVRRLQCRRVWIIDPIDGTKDFIKRNGNFAVHVGLVECGGATASEGAWEPVAAAVLRPIAGVLYTAVRGEGAWRLELDPLAPVPATIERGERIHVSDRDRLERMRSAVSNSNRESRVMRLIRSLGLESYWHIGSLGVKLCQIAEGTADLYINLGLGKAKEWDTCAPALVLHEAGGRLTDLQGNALTYNSDDYYHRHGLLASNGPQHTQLISKIRNFLSAEETK